MPDRFGFIFDSKLIGKLSACNQEIEIAEIKLQSHLLFNVGSYTLTGDANSLLSEIIDSIGDKKVKSIDVIGHTDNVGSEADNMILSQNRVTAIVNELRKIITDSSVIINATGMGEDAPIATNETSEGRNKNRRVEIIVKY